MVELRVINGGGKPWRPNVETDAAWRALFETSGQRMQQECDRIEGRIDAAIRAMASTIPPATFNRPKLGQVLDHRRLEAELEHSLPADVPLHKRGFGVMEDPAP